jgi:hypothetical protein
MEREKVKCQWMSVSRSQETPLHPVVRQLSEEFRQIYGHHAQVTAVRGGFESESGEPLIIVSIDCAGDEMITMLPSEFYGIRVSQIGFVARRSSYERTWASVLRRLLHWSEPKVADWTARWSKELSGASGPFYHQPPMHYLAPTIVKEKLGVRAAGGGLVDLVKEVERLLVRQSGREIFYPADDPDYDWNLAANELARFAERHAGNIPSNE